MTATIDLLKRFTYKICELNTHDQRTYMWIKHNIRHQKKKSYHKFPKFYSDDRVKGFIRQSEENNNDWI